MDWPVLKKPGVEIDELFQTNSFTSRPSPVMPIEAPTGVPSDSEKGTSIDIRPAAGPAVAANRPS